MQPDPTVGRIVHYNNNGTLEAALVVGVHSPTTVTLVSWNSGGTSNTRTSVSLGTEHDTWQWPARA